MVHNVHPFKYRDRTRRPGLAAQLCDRFALARKGTGFVLLRAADAVLT
jgi:hypothetical protein